MQMCESRRAAEPGLCPASCRQSSAACLPWHRTPHLVKGLWDPKGAKDLMENNNFPLFRPFKHIKSEFKAIVSKGRASEGLHYSQVPNAFGRRLVHGIMQSFLSYLGTKN